MNLLQTWQITQIVLSHPPPTIEKKEQCNSTFIILFSLYWVDSIPWGFFKRKMNALEPSLSSIDFYHIIRYSLSTPWSCCIAFKGPTSTTLYHYQNWSFIITTHGNISVYIHARKPNKSIRSLNITSYFP